jgi:hypothetical protein
MKTELNTFLSLTNDLSKYAYKRKEHEERGKMNV